MKKKLAIKVWTPAAEKMEKHFEVLFLRRDAFLNHVLGIEIGRLKECPAEKNTPEVYGYINDELNLLDRKTIAFSLDEELVNKIKQVCEEKNIVCDAFYNRIFLLLVASHEQFCRLLGLDEGWDYELKDHIRNELNDISSPGFYPLGGNAPDAFFFTHYYLNKLAEKDFYTIAFGRQFKNTDLVGLNCFLPPWDIPEEWQTEEMKRELADF